MLSAVAQDPEGQGAVLERKEAKRLRREARWQAWRSR